MSHISTHVLNNTIGEPAAGLSIAVYLQKEEQWDLIAKGTTNKEAVYPIFMSQKKVFRRVFIEYVSPLEITSQV